MTPDDINAAVAPRPDAASADAVVEGWSRLFAYLVVAVMISFTVLLPFFGFVFTVAAASYLRAGDIHARRHGARLLRSLAGPLTAPLDLLRGFAGTLISLPYAAVPAIAVPLAVMATAAVNIEIHPLVAAAWGAGAASYVVLAGPGVRAPRRHLIRVFVSFAGGPRTIAVVGLLLCVLTLGSIAGAIMLQPTFSPLYELKNSLTSDLLRFQHSARHSVS